MVGSPGARYLPDLVNDDEPEEHEAGNEKDLEHGIREFEEPATQPKLEGEKDVCITDVDQVCVCVCVCGDKTNGHVPL